jgi:hypothetical protein
METNFEKISKLIAKSSLSEDDQRMFLESCYGVVDDNLALLVELFIKSPDWIEKVFENFKEKREAAYERNMQRWNDIISSEVSTLDDGIALEKTRTNISQMA